jgi:2-polyprenyl-3-methyl-5-hydroxy-6-metoxy-1,4-benzoquinol methylase
MREVRRKSFGQEKKTSFVDRFGIWLSRRSVFRHIGQFEGKTVCDVGCGYEASLAQEIAKDAAYVTVCDVALSPSALDGLNIRGIEGPFEDTAPDIEPNSMDLVLCMSMLEHVSDDDLVLAHLFRIVNIGGVVIVNVPSWFGKRLLEFSAFKLGLSPAEEMNDHKRYYSPRDLWPKLVSAGFLPENISVRRHKFGLNTLAICKISSKREQK